MNAGTTDLVERLRRLYRDQGTNYVQEAADEIERLTAENERLREACASGWGEPTLVNDLRAERDALKMELHNRNKSPSDRLHNICRAIEDEAASSVFSREEWDRVDARNLALRKERDALRADAERYRWLRDKAGQNTAYDIYKDGGMWSIAFFSADNHLPFDAAIDAARKL